LIIRCLLTSKPGCFSEGGGASFRLIADSEQKRPSRFDRKYLFPDPNLEQRIAYCKFWQGKLADNKDVEYPDELCKAIAEITDKFSFAYMQEAFVAALLTIARRAKDGERRNEEALTRDMGDGWLDVCSVDESDDDDDGHLDDLILWVEIKKQIETLREGMEEEKGTVALGKGRPRRAF
jgi:SpoVK/Ycf46/Vps4 family AAA+-type ATPase